VKTEAEIRKHLADLLRHAQGPCRHPHRTARELAECREGRLMMHASAHLLQWVLGEAPEYGLVVERLAAGGGGRAQQG
jgi:hypothetical protein